MNRAQKRAAHRAKPTDRNKSVRTQAAIYGVMARIQRYTEAEQSLLQTPVYMALAAMKAGTATQDDMGTLCIVCNAGMILGEKIGLECVEIAKAAMLALTRCEQRYRQHGRYGLDGKGLQAIEDCLDYHDQLLTLVTPLQMTRAYDEMRKRIARGETMDVREAA